MPFQAFYNPAQAAPLSPASLLSRSSDARTPQQLSIDPAETPARFWQDDKACSSCTTCSQNFTFFTRRHHCRICGFIFCGSCSACELPGPDTTPVRVCLSCFVSSQSARFARSKSSLSSMTTLPTLDDFLVADIEAVDDDLNPAMRCLIDSKDAYRVPNAKNQAQRATNIPAPSDKPALINMYHGHLRHVVEQLLIRHGLIYSCWLDIITEFAIDASWQLQPHRPDTTISDLVHVLGIASGSSSDSEIISGVVLTGLNIAHRKMRSTIANARILLLDVSMRPKPAPSPVVLTSLHLLPDEITSASYSVSIVERILPLSPDVIISRDVIPLEVSRIFNNRFITVVGGVSNADINMLRRALGVRLVNATTLFSAMSTSSNCLGQCSMFSVDRCLIPSPDTTIRSSMTLSVSGCDPSAFKTLVLHGVRSTQELAMLTAISQTAVLVAWSLSLEISYIFDSSATFLPEQIPTTAGPLPTGTDDDPMATVVDDTTPGALSSSPLVVLHLPWTRSDCMLHTASNEVGTLLPSTALPSWLPTSQLVVWSLEFAIYWLHKSAVTLRHTACFPPSSMKTIFYGADDSSLGEFLFETCFNTRRFCHCGRSTLDHRCCIVHGNGKLIIEVDTLPQNLLQTQTQSDRIMSWLWCRTCRRRSSSVVALGNRTLRFSLTKYFEICLYDYRTRSRHGACGHRLHRDMVRCFGFENLIATVQYSLVIPFEVSVMQPIHIPPSSSARIARIELSRLIVLADAARAGAARTARRDLPSLAIDSAGDVLLNRIRLDHARLRQVALGLAEEGVGPIRARQLLLELFRATDSWQLQGGLAPRASASFESRIKALIALLGDCPLPTLLMACWNVPATFGGFVVPIIRAQVSTQIGHVLSSLQHAAFVMNRSIADIPGDLRSTPLDKVLLSSLLSPDDASERSHCEEVLRSIKSKRVGTKNSAVIDCREMGKVWVGFARQFQALRHCLCDSNYAVVESLARSREWAVEGGKSNALFFRTWDRRLILKRIHPAEAKTFVNLAPEYFDYLADVIFLGRATALTPILGIFELMEEPSRQPMFYILMPNLMHDLRIKRVFDLKGKSSGRLIHDCNTPAKRHSDWTQLETEEDFCSPDALLTGPVLQDENFALFTNGDPLPVLSESCADLYSALENDVKFLADLGIMDYSILVGVREVPPRRLIVGIIDYIRFYSLDKIVENTVKSLIEKGAPTILPPDLYMQRFMDSMHRNFVSAPNREGSRESMPTTAIDIDPNEPSGEVAKDSRDGGDARADMSGGETKRSMASLGSVLGGHRSLPAFDTLFHRNPDTPITRSD